jgi:hypothetical protein
MAPVEGGAIYNCVLCDSFSVITLGILPEKKLARGLKGRDAYEDLLEAFQLQHATEFLLLLPCPTCNLYARQETSGELVIPDQLQQGDFLREGLAVLTPSFLVSFEEGQLPAIFADEARNGSKTKWRLVQGVGPGGIELDRSRTGRIHKPSLRPFGINTKPLALPASLSGRELAAAVNEACAYVEALLHFKGGEEAERVVRAWRWGTPPRPVLEDWVEAKAGMQLDDGEVQRYLAETLSPALQIAANYGDEREINI